MDVLRYVLIFLLTIIVKYTAGSASSQIKNNAPVFINADTSYDRYGNYARNDSGYYFMLGWQDSYGWKEKLDNDYEFASFSEYRDSLGPINFIFSKYNAIDYIFHNKDSSESYYNWFSNLTVSEQPINFIIAPPERDNPPPETDSAWNAVCSLASDNIYNIDSVYDNGFNGIVYGWDTVDEPDTADGEGWYPDTLKKFNRMLKAAEDSNQINDSKIFLNIQWGDNGDRWTFGSYGTLDSVDIVATNIYPLYYTMPSFYTLTTPNLEDIHFPGEHLSALIDSVDGTKPVVAILQGHGALNFIGTAGTDTFLSVRRVPSYAEYRFMTFDAVTRGAAGIWFWAARCAANLFMIHNHPVIG